MLDKLTQLADELDALYKRRKATEKALLELTQPGEIVTSSSGVDYRHTPQPAEIRFIGRVIRSPEGLTHE